MSDYRRNNWKQGMKNRAFDRTLCLFDSARSWFVKRKVWRSAHLVREVRQRTVPPSAFLMKSKSTTHIWKAASRRTLARRSLPSHRRRIDRGGSRRNILRIAFPGGSSLLGWIVIWGRPDRHSKVLFANRARTTSPSPSPWKTRSTAASASSRTLTSRSYPNTSKQTKETPSLPNQQPLVGFYSKQAASICNRN